jgi:hypothetical protein
LLLQRLRTHELKELFFKHEMLLVDVHTIMALTQHSCHQVQSKPVARNGDLPSDDQTATVR